MNPEVTQVIWACWIMGCVSMQLAYTIDKSGGAPFFFWLLVFLVGVGGFAGVFVILLFSAIKGVFG